MQIGERLITRQTALRPHTPGHGSTHFELRQTESILQSEFITHSGLQFGGEPRWLGKHLHTARSSLTLQTLFEPHGDGKHGFTGRSNLAGENI